MLSELVILALVPPASLLLVLVFLTIVYLRGGRDDLKAAAEAVHKVRSTVGVVPAIRAAIQAWKSRN